jgi:hypothetical protein
MLIQCFVSVQDNPATNGGVFILVVPKDQAHRCWHKWFESGPVAGREAKAIGLATIENAPDGRHSKTMRYKILPVCEMDTTQLDTHWELGRPAELRGFR